MASGGWEGWSWGVRRHILIKDDGPSYREIYGSFFCSSFDRDRRRGAASGDRGLWNIGPPWGWRRQQQREQRHHPGRIRPGAEEVADGGAGALPDRRAADV